MPGSLKTWASPTNRLPAAGAEKCLGSHRSELKPAAERAVLKAENWADESGSTAGHSNWKKHSGAIPEKIRNRLTKVIRANLRSKKPVPMVLKVGENVDHSHDLQVKTFKHKGNKHIGLHMLCPNSSLKK